MAEPDDLLGKADALMSRHRSPRTAAEPETEIPLLDEVVELTAEGDDLPVLTELVEPASLDTERTEELAASIRASLLAGLQPEIDTLIEESVREGLAPLLERLFGELQLIARTSLSDAINTAVEEELKRRKWGD